MRRRHLGARVEAVRAAIRGDHQVDALLGDPVVEVRRGGSDPISEIHDHRGNIVELGDDLLTGEMAVQA